MTNYNVCHGHFRLVLWC